MFDNTENAASQKLGVIYHEIYLGTNQNEVIDGYPKDVDIGNNIE